jgi:prolyl-tRNA synthetase
MDSVIVRCPYCGEDVEILLEEDLAGQMIWDCEVCCRPWDLTIYRDAEGARIEVRSADDG